MTVQEKQKQRIAVVLSAPWCNTCGPFKRKLEQQGIPFLSASIDEEVSISLSVYTGWDEGASLMPLVQAFGISTLPTTLVFDENKELVARILGGKDVEAVKNALQK